MSDHRARIASVKKWVVATLVFWGVLKIYSYVLVTLMGYITLPESLSLGISIACTGIMVLLALLTTSFLVKDRNRLL